MTSHTIRGKRFGISSDSSPQQILRSTHNGMSAHCEWLAGLKDPARLSLEEISVVTFDVTGNAVSRQQNAHWIAQSGCVPGVREPASA